MSNQKPFDNSFKINLQLFADEMLSPEQMAQLQAMFDGAEEAPQEPIPQEGMEQSTDEPQEDAVPVEELPPTEQPIQPEQPQEGSGKVLGKFNSVEDALAAYQALEAKSTQTSQELARERDTTKQLLSAVEALQNQMSMTQAPAAEEPENLEDPEARREAFMEKFYNSGEDAIIETIMKVIQPVLEPLKTRNAEYEQSEKWAEAVDSFRASHPDTDEFAEDMGKILMENPDLRNMPNSLEIAYDKARSMRYSPAPDPKSYLEDDSFVEQNILNNPNVTEKIIQKYLMGLQKGEAPVVIGNKTAGGSTPITPPAKLTSMEEANKAAEKLFR